jgi:hypothetical protein
MAVNLSARMMNDPGTAVNGLITVMKLSLSTVKLSGTGVKGRRWEC